MFTTHSRRVVLLLAIVALLASESPVRSDEGEPSADFKNGVALGRALDAMPTSVLCVTLLSELNEGEEGESEMPTGAKALLIHHLLSSAVSINRAVELPDSVVKKASFKKRLTEIADYLFKEHPLIMDASEYESQRDEFVESLKLIKSDKIREAWLVNYDWHIETVKMLVKYRSDRSDTKSNESPEKE